jgi:copper(I)-binding protein
MEKKMKRLFQLIMSLLILSSMGSTYAKGISVDNPYVREVPPGQMTSASFLLLKNDNNKEISLIKASSDVAKNVELHEHVHNNGMMQMRQVPKIVIPANSTQELKPGGYHIMLIGLTRKIKAGDKININLEFDNGDKKTITATVKKIMQGMMKPMKHGAMKTDTAHLNPMPNLMTIFKKTPESLNLTQEQIEKLKAGIKKREPITKDLLDIITKYEKEILKETLADKPLSDIDQLANNIIQERLNLINGKAGCAESVKAILDEKQFANLQSIYKKDYAKTLKYSDDTQGNMAMIKHVNPLPNLMLVIKKMGDKLNLSEKQAIKLKQWSDERDPIMSRQYKAIVNFENELQNAALNNAPHAKQAELADAIMQNRMKVMRGKLFSRDKMKEILNPQQYKKLIELYKANMM